MAKIRGSHHAQGARRRRRMAGYGRRDDFMLAEHKNKLLLGSRRGQIPKAISFILAS